MFFYEFFQKYKAECELQGIPLSIKERSKEAFVKYHELRYFERWCVDVLFSALIFYMILSIICIVFTLDLKMFNILFIIGLMIFLGVSICIINKNHCNRTKKISSDYIIIDTFLALGYKSAPDILIIYSLMENTKKKNAIPNYIKNAFTYIISFGVCIASLFSDNFWKLIIIWVVLTISSLYLILTSIISSFSSKKKKCYEKMESDLEYTFYFYENFKKDFEAANLNNNSAKSCM